MSALPKGRMDPQTFLSWAEGREGRYELVSGSIRMMTGGSRAHALISGRIAAVLSAQLDPAVFDVTTADFGVVIGGHVRYPDVVVDRIGAMGDLKAASPVVIVEVLSPSSLYIDINEKAAEYQSLRSVEAYLVASQEEPRMWIWQREADGWPERPSMIEGRSSSLRIGAVGVDLSFDAIYRRIGPEGEGITRDPRS